MTTCQAPKGGRDGKERTDRGESCNCGEQDVGVEVGIARREERGRERARSDQVVWCHWCEGGVCSWQDTRVVICEQDRQERSSEHTDPEDEPQREVIRAGLMRDGLRVPDI
jgi:hypothetical protein